MAALSTVFMLVDDYAVTGTSAGGAGQVGDDFVAPSTAAATQVAYLVATALQRNVRLVQKYAPNPPYTLVSAGPANTALTVVPSGIGIA